MRLYETVGIIRSDAGDDIVKAIIQKAKNAVEGGGGKIEKLDEWGRRKFAYPINKKNEGFYFVITYTSSPLASKELERGLKFNEDVVRYQTVRLERLIEAKPADAVKAVEGAEAVEKGGQA
ncbi:30S ribosomal protein S6 [bacterium]|nr:MAG: 30S ribosomal protein S6 [bacterium]